MNIVKLLAAGVPRVLGGVEGMTFPVFKYTDCVDGRGMMAHVCDYRYPTSAEHKEVSAYQIWSLPPEGYEVVVVDSPTVWEVQPHYGGYPRSLDPRNADIMYADRALAMKAIDGHNAAGANAQLRRIEWRLLKHDEVWSPAIYTKRGGDGRELRGPHD